MTLLALADYSEVMTKRAPTPVRFESDVAVRLAAFVAANPGLSLSSAANRLVDEGLRMGEHPGIVFRPGPTGRRAALAAGPDVWEIVRAIRSAKEAETELSADELLELVTSNTGVHVESLRIAIRYWACFQEEIDAEIDAADAAEEAAEEAWRRGHQLLTG
jgi:hypothetical protein